MDNEELIYHILNELNNLKNLDYSKPESEVLKEKNLILEKIEKLISQIQLLKVEEEKQIEEEINNIRILNLKEGIFESIENIVSVLSTYINNFKEDIEFILDETKEEQQEEFANGKIDKLSNELQSLTNANYVTKITAKRGRLIGEIQKEISKIKKCGKEDEKTLEILGQLEERLQTEIENHKNQLNDRYSKEFLDKEATVPAILTVLPVGVALQATKIETCIREMKAAKTNKQRIFAALNIAKALGMTVVTPVIFTVKFIIKHWYLLMLLLSMIKFHKSSKVPQDKELSPNNEVPQDSEIPQNAEVPQNVEIPRVTEMPKATEIPRATEVPKAAEVPKATEMPKATEIPKVTEIPKATEIPENVEIPKEVSDVISNKAQEISQIDAEKNLAYSLAKVLLLLDAHAHHSGVVWFNTYEDAVEYVKNNKDLDEIARKFGTIVNDGNYDDIIKRYLVEGDPVNGNRLFEWLIGEYGAYSSEQELLEAYRSNELITSGTIEGINLLNHLDNNPQLITQMQKGDLTGVLDYVNNNITPLDFANIILTGFLKLPSANAGIAIGAGVNQVTENIAEETAKEISEQAGSNIIQFPNLIDAIPEEVEESILHKVA